MGTVATQLAGKTGPEIAQMVASGDISAKSARAFVLERAGNKFDQQVQKAQAPES
jgi:hypothetical protein